LKFQTIFDVASRAHGVMQMIFQAMLITLMDHHSVPGTGETDFGPKCDFNRGKSVLARVLCCAARAN
jgi:hypothetical protein